MHHPIELHALVLKLVRPKMDRHRAAVMALVLTGIVAALNETPGMTFMSGDASKAYPERSVSTSVRVSPVTTASPEILWLRRTSR
jgi:hypothetical protein